MPRNWHPGWYLGSLFIVCMTIAHIVEVLAS